jgi:hypothetical protein
MPGSTRISGTALALSFAGTDYWADITSVKLENEASPVDVTTFADAAAGGAKRYYFTISAVQSMQSTSFWRYLWANVGNTVAYRFAPLGNTTPTADAGHLIGTVKILSRPAIGGDAGLNTNYSFDVRLDCQQDPTTDYGTDGIPALSNVPGTATVGSNIVLTGTKFTGATQVKFAATNATSFVVVSDTTIAAVVPAGTGVKAITVVNALGTSNALNCTIS